MDIKTIRKMNVRLLEREIGSLSALARLAGSTQSYLSQCVGKSGLRSIGDPMARRLEHAMGKPHGWLDVPHADEGDMMLARLIYDRLLTIPPSQLHAIAELFGIKEEGMVWNEKDEQPQTKSKGRVITLEDDAKTKKR